MNSNGTHPTQVHAEAAPEVHRSTVLEKAFLRNLKPETKMILGLAALGLLAVVISPIAMAVFNQVSQPKTVPPVGVTGTVPVPTPYPSPSPSPTDIDSLSDQMAVLLQTSNQVQGIAVQMEADRLLESARKDAACNSDPNCALARYKQEAIQRMLDSMFRLQAVQAAQAKQGGKKP